ncbi:MAG: hypothetical protein M1823_005893 [Watsoniomyces obsoletus]|nr:MAG: hypothetical protein M1823_005893 [Watsoniomyces obsoletus]
MSQSISIPPFEHTAVEAIPEITNRLRKTFLSHKTRPLEYRLQQLRKLYWAIHDNEDALIEACRLDMGKPRFEAAAGEVGWSKNDIMFTCKNLERWARDEKAPDISWMNQAMGPKIRKDPLGTVLVIGPSNYPIQICLGPIIGAVAAGCTVAVKPSENAPNCAAVLQRVIEQSFDPTLVAVVQGAVPETTELLNHKWDKIFYTGSGQVGTIIAKKAAETLTPVTLELGGRNPAIVTKNADPRLAARRLLWGKVANAGQICLSENYTLVDKQVLSPFLAELRIAYDQFFPEGAEKSSDYSRIINHRHYHRIKSMLDQSQGKILLGGSMNEEDKFIEPTVIQIDDINDSLMKDEIFGPILPIYPVDDLDEAIRIVNKVSETPLGVYPFGNKAETDRVLRETRSGGASVNDAFAHGTIPTLEFGGVGESGQGCYRGKASFDCFTHRRAVTTTPSWIESMLAIRYPPYAGKLEKFRKSVDWKPNFDREGRVKRSWSDWLALGGEDLKGVLGRYILVVGLAAGVRYYLQRTGSL